MEINEFHEADGWLFKRLEDGSVRVRRVTADSTPAMTHVLVEHTISPTHWASVVAHVSAQGETWKTYQDALEFHGTAALPIQHPGDADDLPTMHTSKHH